MLRRMSLVTFLSLVTSCVLAERTQAQDWHNVSQSTRNSRILNVAYQYYMYYPNTRLECKAWVQHVVSQASNGVVWLPQNNPNYPWLWYWSPDVQTVYSDRWDGVPFTPGEIIQAKVRTASGGESQHTMIVVWVSSAEIMVIDCNYRGDRTVLVRRQSWAQFRNGIIRYTLYRVK